MSFDPHSFNPLSFEIAKDLGTSWQAFVQEHLGIDATRVQAITAGPMNSTACANLLQEEFRKDKRAFMQKLVSSLEQEDYRDCLEVVGAWMITNGFAVQNLGAACQQELDANSSRAFVNGARGAGHESFRPNAQIDGWAGEHSAFQFPVDKNAEMRRSYMEDSSALKDLIQQGTSTPEIAREFGDQEHIAKMYPLFDGDRLVNVEVNVSLADQIIPTKDVTDSSTPQTRLFDVHRSVVQVLLKSCSEPVGLAGVFASFHKNHTMLCYAIDHRIASNIENVRPSLQLFCTRVYTPEELMEEVGRHFAWSEVAKGPLHELELQMWLLHRFPQRSKKRVVCSFQDLQKQQLSWLKYHDSDLPDRVFVCLHERLSSSTVLKNVKNNDESLCGHATLHIIYDHDDVVVPVAGNLKVLRELVADKPIPFVMLRIILSRQKLIDIKFQSIHFILQGTEESFEALKNEIATNEELRAYNFRLLPYTPEKDEGAAQGAAEPEAHALDAKSPSFFGDEFAKSLPVHEEEEEGEEVEEDPPTPLEPSFVDEVAALLRRVVSQSAPPVPKLVLVFSHEVEYTKHVFLSSFADASEGALVHVELRCARISGLSPSGHRFDVLLCNAKDRSLVLAAAQGMPIDLVVHDTRACEPVDVGQCSLQIMPPLSGKPKVVDDVTKALAELRTERGEELFGAFREIVRTIMEKKTGSSVEDLAFELEKARLSAHPEPIPLLDAAIAQGDVDKEGGTYSLSEKMQKSLSRARLRDDDWENPPRLTCTVSQVFDVKADSWKEVESPSVLPRPKPDGRGFQHIRPLESAVQVSITTKRSPLNRTVFSVLAVETILRFIECTSSPLAREVVRQRLIEELMRIPVEMYHSIVQLILPSFRGFPVFENGESVVAEVEARNVVPNFVDACRERFGERSAVYVYASLFAKLPLKL